MTWHSFVDAWLRESGLVVVVVGFGTVVRGAATVLRGAGTVLETTVVATVGLCAVVVAAGPVVDAVVWPGCDDEQPAMINNAATCQTRGRLVGTMVH
ncbi:MAG: hypothetical protein M3083_14350 [Actinomycetota bacterium]|nr:hypothetical protein [Actinomycetota bacterium]